MKLLSNENKKRRKYNMFKVEPSLKLVTKCGVAGEDICEFVKKMNSCGYYTFIEDYYEDEEFDNDDEVDILVFKITMV